MTTLVSQIPSPVRYMMSAGFNWLVDFVVFILIFNVTGIPIGILIARIVGGTASFVTHKWFSFESRTKPTMRELIGYALLWLTNYAIVTALVLYLPGGTNTLVVAAKFGVEILVFAANYLFLRRLFIPRR